MICLVWELVAYVIQPDYAQRTMYLYHMCPWAFVWKESRNKVDLNKEREEERNDREREADKFKDRVTRLITTEETWNMFKELFMIMLHSNSNTVILM